MKKKARPLETGLPVYRPVHNGGRKRPRVVEADWLAANTVLTESVIDAE